MSAELSHRELRDTRYLPVELGLSMTHWPPLQTTTTSEVSEEGGGHDGGSTSQSLALNWSQNS